MSINITSLFELQKNIDELIKSHNELKEALRRFANLNLEGFDDKPDHHPVYGRNNSILLVGEFRKARQLLNE